MEWVLNIVKENSLILELGPAVGTLTKHLKEDKNCRVDIVELDAEAGAKAEQYARKCCLGKEEGDLEGDKWKNIIGREEKYDYIVILDVLEHLRNAQELLKYLKTLLKEEGEILLSLPNVAHNSVIINLINNKFDYTEVGLLDDTHVRFFTVNSLGQLLRECGLHAVKREYKQVLVGENEIKNSYQDVPDAIEQCLRMREYADVYQFLYRIQKGEGEEGELLSISLPYTLYPLEVYDTVGNNMQVRYVNPGYVHEEIDVSEYGDVIRIDPIDWVSIIKELSILLLIEDEWKEAKITLTNGILIENEGYVFLDNDPQILIDNSNRAKRILISYRCVLLQEEIIGAWRNEIPCRLRLENDYRSLKIELGEIQSKFQKVYAEAQYCAERGKQLQEEVQSYVEREGQLRKEIQLRAEREERLHEELIVCLKRVREKDNIVQQHMNLILEKDFVIQQNISELQRKREEIEKCKDEYKEKESVISVLEEELRIIKNSKIYRICYKVKNFFQTKKD